MRELRRETRWDRMRQIGAECRRMRYKCIIKQDEDVQGEKAGWEHQVRRNVSVARGHFVRTSAWSLARWTSRRGDAVWYSTVRVK